MWKQRNLYFEKPVYFFLNILFILAKHRYIKDRSSLNRQRSEGTGDSLYMVTGTVCWENEEAMKVRLDTVHQQDYHKKYLNNIC